MVLVFTERSWARIQALYREWWIFMTTEIIHLIGLRTTIVIKSIEYVVLWLNVLTFRPVILERKIQVLHPKYFMARGPTWLILWQTPFVYHISRESTIANPSEQTTNYLILTLLLKLHIVVDVHVQVACSLLDLKMWCPTRRSGYTNLIYTWLSLRPWGKAVNFWDIIIFQSTSYNEHDIAAATRRNIWKRAHYAYNRWR